ncbi:claspin [Harpegnathos saltator]|uniref:claspin n=1 Tax=Harpegnathos saltator TaxID=610380 RepID=UPI00058E4435|nr:claspin [Harpegnathos saltator]
MTMIVADYPVITGVTEIFSNNDKDFKENEHHIENVESNIPKVASICINEETHNQKHKENVEEYSGETVCDSISNEKNSSCNFENLQNNKVSNNPTESDHLDDNTDLIENSKSIEVKEAVDKYFSDNNENKISETIFSKRLMTFVNSDPEEETDICETSNEGSLADRNNYSGSSEQIQIAKYKESSKTKYIRRIVDSESEDDEEASNIYNSSQTPCKTLDVTTNGYQVLIDPESEEEKETLDSSVAFDGTDTSKIKNVKGISAQKIKGSLRVSKIEAMHKIYSESQRLLRETGVSLPYHRPKQRTLQEFLNRKKLSVSLPKAPSTSAKLKMSSAIVSQILAEKEKEAEDFYKSSDSEDDTREITLLACENVKKSSITNEEKPATDIELICAPDTKINKTNDQDSHGNGEIIQQDNINLVAHEATVENDICEIDQQDNGHVLGLPLPKFTDDTSIDRKKLLPNPALNSKVTLKGSPGMIIDLMDYTESNSKGLDSLLERFFCKHVVNTNKQTDNRSEVTVVHLQDTQHGPIPIKEVLPYKLPADTDNPELNKPGAKLMRLKEQLKLQMSLKRNEEWKQKEIELQTQEKEIWSEEEETEDHLDDRGKVDILESSDSGESEPEENDVCIKDKKRKKCLFADDEAEVTENENSDADETDTDEAECTASKQFASCKHGDEEKCTNDNECDVEMEEKEGTEGKDKGGGNTDEDEDEDGNDIEDETELTDEDNDNIGESISVRNEKKRKRLIQKYQDDDSENEDSQLRSIMEIHTSKAHSEDNGWTSENKSNIQKQPEVTKSQICKTPMAKTSMLDFVSPITQLSILNGSLDSDRKEHPVDKHDFIFTVNRQSERSSQNAHEIRNKAISQKKLFYDIEESIDDDYLMQLCSTKFESTQRSDLGLESSTWQSNNAVSQLHELNAGSRNARLIGMQEERKSSGTKSKISQGKSLFGNPISLNTTKAEQVSPVDSERLKLRIVSSDDEENTSEEEDTFLKHRKRPAKRLDLSDSEEENARSSDEEDDNANGEETEENGYVDYDSEENEVMVVPTKDMQKVAANFLEEEAELSESDWDSADEDEKDLDKLEFEEADEEHIDEDEVKDQVGKLHTKQVLDEDKREIRLLKELLFEDGDLHTDGAGRERKFKWRNIDKLGNDIEMPQVLVENDGWVDVQEDEEEAKWKKLRHERDKFLEERMKTLSSGVEDDLRDSQIFKFGLKTVEKIRNNQSQKQDISSDKVNLSENTEPIMPRNITDLLYVSNTGKKSHTIYNVIKRRSLLSRGEESLARIASLAKQSDTVSHTTNTRNFVFQYIDPSVSNTSKEEETSEEKGGKDWNLQNQPRKRKVTSNFSTTMKKRRK